MRVNRLDEKQRQKATSVCSASHASPTLSPYIVPPCMPCAQRAVLDLVGMLSQLPDVLADRSAVRGSAPVGTGVSPSSRGNFFI